MFHSLTRRQKRYCFLAFDWALVPVSLIGAQILHQSGGVSGAELAAGLPLLVMMCIIAPLAIVAFRLPWIKLTALDTSALWRIAATALALGCSAALGGYLLAADGSRAVPVLMAVLFFALCVLGRTVGAAVFASYGRSEHGVDENGRAAARRMPVAIYGAGGAGIQMIPVLKGSTQMRPVVLVDDNPSLHGLIVSGIKVVSPRRVRSMVEAGDVQRILLAMPSIAKLKQEELVKSLSDLPCDVQVLPSLTEMITGKAQPLKTLTPDALLGRDKVTLDVPDIAKAYSNRTVMVTGAGGSIGAELCRQVLECDPERIVFFEQSELALYGIDRDLRAVAEARGIDVRARLGSVTDRARVAEVLAGDQVDIVLHAAAYKHVPLVEDNVLEGAQNNVIGTQTVALAAIEAGLERFILISSDKAVRPTNIMGATKRMAELLVQDMASRSTRTRFSMVRFGNVLGSSGSVLPLFQEQIRAGGPVTVTDAEVTRYFMTIHEAARLVLLAGAYSKGGDVFVLDMGQPMKIVDLARQMIQMSGARVRSAERAGSAIDDGIEIKFTGLRPGEKLYEEVLIDSASMVTTPHSKILRAQESGLSQIEVAALLRAVQGAILDRDEDRFRATVRQYVTGYQRPAIETEAGGAFEEASDAAREKMA